ncbi:M20/M25/M40 family metallo-hydrolase [Armatimonas rosea]|uniref:Acetylornithine deacetylase/succinyl-diaminopimelate desuccinylase-like protein n=1 Tax=Armatimonas rosea TaxID=685828 RepID=A0A7W9W5Y4_ARMRO|nr:M20/M25/M40 family metallo-hydrolase [Armatimonas rosea]MBB6049022.1 acetylornithine deacetylase/succinyl-diaminopimelate desuccinylase-like protein [Armatimonas rosea]
MPETLSQALAAALPTVLDELAELVAIPSVAAKPDSPMTLCAEKVAELYRKRGLTAQLVPTDGGPTVVYAEDRSAGVEAPTVLFYNHYDVQPAEPFALWESDPWILRRDGDFLYGRGSSDDKGHIACRLLALDALKTLHGGTLPVNVKVLVEGEEEVASVHLVDWIERHRALLAADVTLWEFGGVNAAGQPELICGLRGIATFELRAKTIAHDAHSGVGGTILPNAAWRLVHALASLKGPDERIQIPGHYDLALPATPADLDLLAQLSPELEADLRAEFGVAHFLGEATGTELHRRAIFEPSCTINGLWSGYQGAGVKTVLPAEATAKLDFRLVPDMDPEVVHQSLCAYLADQGFSDIEVVYLGGQRPGRVSPDHPLIQLAAQTAEAVYGTPASIVPLSPVTGPVHPFAVGLGQPIATIGCGYPGARVHAPNENLRVSDLLRGAEHTARFLMALIK